jgi:hypothetical protein
VNVLHGRVSNALSKVLFGPAASLAVVEAYVIKTYIIGK